MRRTTRWIPVVLILALAGIMSAVSAAVAHADFVGSDMITFEGYEEGTPITNQYEADGILFSGAAPEEPPFIAGDGSSLTNPVLSGDPRFFGPIHGEFVVPGTSTPTTVNGLAMDVGYIDDPGSVTLTIITTTGSETLTANEEGFDHLETETTNITGFVVEEIDYEENGFEIDNVSFTPGSPPPAPAPAAPAPLPPPPPASPPPPTVSLNPCAITHGSLTHDLLASIKCVAYETKQEAECAFGILTLAPLKAFDAAKTAAGLYDLRKVKAGARPIAKLYNAIMSAKFGKNAPAGFRTGAQVIARIKEAKTAYAVVKLLPDIAQAVSQADFSEIALDFDEIIGLKPCVEAVVNAIDN
jgi:hypothetical protein